MARVGRVASEQLTHNDVRDLCERVLDTSIEDHCDRLYDQRPRWATGTVSSHDARFLFQRVVHSRAAQIVELGTASGWSTVFLAEALATARRAGLVNGVIGVTTVDISPTFYADPAKSVGDAARDVLAPASLQHVSFLNPADASTVRERHRHEPIEFLFVDANHRHPYPCLDLLCLLDVVAAGATVVLHDVNLPNVVADGARGVNHLFADLPVRWETPIEDTVPNIASFVMPDTRTELRDVLLSVLWDRPWEAEPDRAWLTEVLK